MKTLFAGLFLLLGVLGLQSHALAGSNEIGVVILHGKGGSPNTKWIQPFADQFSAAGFQVANLEMPWSKQRRYDVNVAAALDEIDQAFRDLRAQGTTHSFIIGHSQGGLFALVYAGHAEVDGVIAVAPGGGVDSKKVMDEIRSQVAKAKKLIQQQADNTPEDFYEYEGSKGQIPIRTTPAIYFDWFSPKGEMRFSKALPGVLPNTPVLYVSPTNDYTGLRKIKQKNFNQLPRHPDNLLYEPDSDHLHAPLDSAEKIISWIQGIVK